MAVIFGAPVSRCNSPATNRPGRYREVPPDVTTGCVVVVVGGLVVVVAGGLVVGVTSDEPVVGVVGVAGVVAGVVVVVVVDTAGPDVAGCAVVGTGEGAGALAAAAEPGCSLATVTQMKAVAPPAATITVPVRRLILACARVRETGE